VIRPADLRKDWPWVKPLVDEVRRKRDSQWWVEDVYAAVSTGKAAMYVSDDPEGVIVLYPDKEAWTNEVTLFIWLVWCRDGMVRIQDEANALIDRLAKNIGAKKVVMDGRRGWEKHGWTIRNCTYEREVGNG
jgi:hypothetical protein